MLHTLIQLLYMCFSIRYIIVTSTKKVIHDFFSHYGGMVVSNNRNRRPNQVMVVGVKKIRLKSHRK
jgi:hypothetical protein